LSTFFTDKVISKFPIHSLKSKLQRSRISRSQSHNYFAAKIIYASIDFEHGYKTSSIGNARVVRDGRSRSLSHIGLHQKQKICRRCRN